MGSFRQGLIARRVAVSAFAVYALLLQALASMEPVAALRTVFPSGITGFAAF
jgi:hypothetical protein